MRIRCTLRTALRVAVATATALGSGCSNHPTAPGTRPPSSPARLVTLAWEHPSLQGNDLKGIWGFADGSRIAVGEAGTVLRSDGTTWRIASFPSHADLEAVWGSAPDDIWVVGRNAYMAHYDGTRWTGMRLPVTGNLWGVHGSSRDDVWVVGDEGQVLHGRGPSWTVERIPMTGRLRILWAYAPDDVYVGGTSAQMFHYDGSTWTRMYLPGHPFPGDELADIWGPGAGTLLVITDRSDQVAWDGTRFEWRGAGHDGFIGSAIWGLDLQNFVMVGAEFGHRVVDGVFLGGQDTTRSDGPLVDAWGTSMDDITAVGQFGNIVHRDASTWHAVASAGEDHQRVRDLVTTPAGAVVGIDWDGTLLRRDATGTWREEPRAEVGYDMYGVWSDDVTTVAVGWFAPDFTVGDAVILRDDGSGFVRTDITHTDRLFDVWGATSSDLWVSGTRGVLLHGDASGWTLADSGRVGWLRSLAGSSAQRVFGAGLDASGLHGAVAVYDGTAWSYTSLSEVRECFDVCATPAGEAWAACGPGRVAHYDGTAWHVMQTGSSLDLYAIAVAGDGSVIGAGFGGEMVRYDGASWERLAPNTHRTFRTATALPNGDLLLAGDRGAILRWSPSP